MKSLAIRFLFRLGKPAPDSNRINQKKDYVLDDERRSAFKPAVNLQAIEARIKITKPATVMRAFRLAATRAAARTVVTAANVLRIASSSIPSPVIIG